MTEEAKNTEEPKIPAWAVKGAWALMSLLVLISLTFLNYFISMYGDVKTIEARTTVLTEMQQQVADHEKRIQQAENDIKNNRSQIEKIEEVIR